MGSMRFIFPSDRITEDMAQRAYLSGFDRIPWQVSLRRTSGELVLERNCSDSGNLHIPWNVEGHGQIALSTGTLMEREEAYFLPLELARGKLSQIRNQISEWQIVGLAIPEAVHEKVREAMGDFARCIVLDHGSEESVELAEGAIRTTLDAAHLLTASYSDQALAIRRRSGKQFPVFLAADLGAAVPDESHVTPYLDAFDAANVPLTWREIETGEETYCWEAADKQIEWCRSHNLRTTAGPLVLFDKSALPDWITLYEEDFEAVISFSSDYVRHVVERYRGKVDLWQCAGRVNTGDVLSLSEEEKVRLTARAVELTRSLDPETPVVVAFDQPWAEYLGQREMDFPPLHFADALVRANLGLSGLALEVNVGYQPDGSLVRDPLEFNRLIDYWSLLGVPIYLSVSVPSSAQKDPLARRGSRVLTSDWTPRTQEAWVQRYVPLLMSKPIVHGLIWTQLRDSEPHDFAHGGLIGPDHQAKPALGQFAAIRKAVSPA
jgi:hypothetical protein